MNQNTDFITKILKNIKNKKKGVNKTFSSKKH